jgi:hypothetical protein
MFMTVLSHIFQDLSIGESPKSVFYLSFLCIPLEQAHIKDRDANHIKDRCDTIINKNFFLL